MRKVLASRRPARPADPCPASRPARGRRCVRVLAWATMVLGVHWSGPAAATEIAPGTDLCATLDALRPGDELVLQPGDYQGPCTVRRGGIAGAPIVIRAADPSQPPRIVYTGDNANVLTVNASHVRIQGLAFGPTALGVDGVRIVTGTNISVEGCQFSGLGGIAIVANSGTVRELTVLENVIRGSHSTGMYFGCHDGRRCLVSALRVERNYIHQIQAVDPEIGYGLEVKLNSSGVIRDNVIIDTKGPGIMVYGSRDMLSTRVVERNFVTGSRTSSGIVVGGGPALVRNNITVLNAEGGIALEDYGRRGLLRGIVVAHNTVYRGGLGGILAAGPGRVQDAWLVNNAVQPSAGTPALPKDQPGIRIVGNVDCTWAPCFVDPVAFDFSPVLGSLLSTPGAMRAEPWAPTDDYFGSRRGRPPLVGAVEQPRGPIRLSPRP